MAEADFYLLSRSDRDKLRKMRRAMEAMNVNVVGGKRFTGKRPAHNSFDAWYPFYNDSGEEMPAHAIGRVTDSTDAGQETGQSAGSGNPILKVKKPSTDFWKRYIVNGPYAVADGEYGWCLTRGPCLILYDTGTPANGEGWGPKPGQWSLSKGFPCTTLVDDLHNSSDKLLLGTLHEITEVFGKPQSDIAAATGATTPSTGTVIVQYFDGTSYQASTFELEGTNILPYKIKAGRLYKWVAVGDQWCAVEPASRSWKGTIAAPVAAGATISVTLSDGTAHTAENVSGRTLQTGSVLATDDAYTGGMLLTGGGEPGDIDVSTITVVTNVRYDSTSHKWQKKTRTVDVINPSSESDWTDIHALTEYSVVEDVEDTGTELRQTKVTIYATEIEEGESSTITPIDDCEEE